MWSEDCTVVKFSALTEKTVVPKSENDVSLQQNVIRYEPPWRAMESSQKDNIEIYVDEAIDEGCRLTVMKMQTKRIDIVKVNHQLCGFVAFVKQLLSKADLIQGYYVPLIPKFVDGKLFLEIDYAEEVALTDKGKEYLTYVPNPNTCVKPTKEDLDTYANICIELAQYIVDKYKDQ